MELIKKKIKIVTTTGTTTGCTGNCYVIIPYSGTGVTYNFNMSISAQAGDWGFFDTFYDPEATGATGATIPSGSYTVSGTSSSRLNELRKYSTDGTLEQLYFISTDPTLEDGVDNIETVTGTTASTYVYYIGGITYVEEQVSGETSQIYFMFESEGYNSEAFDNLPYIKNEALLEVNERPIVDNNVFITRDENTAFQNNYRLRNIGNLTELTYYAGGAYFNVVENI